MNSKGFEETISTLRGRTWTPEESSFLVNLVNLGTQKIKMKKVTHILIGSRLTKVPNPYYSDNNAGIEPRTIEENVLSIEQFYSEAEFKEFIGRNPGMLDNSSYTFYKVDRLTPKITKTITIDV